MNIMRTGLLMAALTALFLLAGYLLGGEAGMTVALLFAAGTNLYAYWNADRVLLSMHGAREVTDVTAPDLLHLVRQLSGRAGLPMPTVYIAPNDQPNAFATGRSPAHAALCVTSGLLARLNQEELAGVLSHELGHVKLRDTLPMTLAATIAGAPSLLAPVAALLVPLTVSRTREFDADREGAKISGRPLWLAAALQKVAPAAGSFASHPATEARIARLQAMAEQSVPRPGLWA